jgi:hypothetical protein
MQVNKLTITPFIKGYKAYTTYEPENNMAFTLIKERLMYRDSSYQKIPKRIKRLPKNIPSWVNPETHVNKFKKFI